MSLGGSIYRWTKNPNGFLQNHSINSTNPNGACSLKKGQKVLQDLWIKEPAKSIHKDDCGVVTAFCQHLTAYQHCIIGAE